MEKETATKKTEEEKKFEVGGLYECDGYVYAVFAINSAIVYALRFNFSDHSEPDNYELHVLTTFSTLPWYMPGIKAMKIVKIMNSTDNLTRAGKYLKIGDLYPESLYEIHEILFQYLMEYKTGGDLRSVDFD